MAAGIPLHKWSRRFDAPEPPETVHRVATPPVLEILQLLPMAYRIGSYISTERSQNREPIFDLSGIALQPPNPGPNAGVPLGGIGCGSIGRGFRGEFRRWSLNPGRYVHQVVSSDVFMLRVRRGRQVYAKVLSVHPPADETNTMQDFDWGLPSGCGEYHALFPRSWTVYEDPVPGVRVTVKQLSPFLPENYSESSLPAATFSVLVENKSTLEEMEASVMFVFQNGLDPSEKKRDLHDFEHSSFEMEVDSVRSEAAGIGDVSAGKGSAAVGEAFSTPPEPPSAATTTASMDQSTAIFGILMGHASSCNYHHSAESRLFSADHRRSASKGGYRNDDQGEEGFCQKGSGMSSCYASASATAGTVEERITDKNSFAMAALAPPNTRTTYRRKFITWQEPEAVGICGAGEVDYDDGCEKSESNGPCNAQSLWNEFLAHGDISDGAEEEESARGRSTASAAQRSSGTSSVRYGAAICMRRTIPPASASASSREGNRAEEFRFALAWDHPIARFGSGLGLPRYYTRFFGQSGNRAGKIASYALLKCQEWEREIVAWQTDVWNRLDHLFQRDTGRTAAGGAADAPLKRAHSASSSSSPGKTKSVAFDPSFFYHQLFNELYYLTDGGTVWTDSCAGVSNQRAVKAETVQVVPPDSLSPTESLHTDEANDIHRKLPRSPLHGTARDSEGITGHMTGRLLDDSQFTEHLLRKSAEKKAAHALYQAEEIDRLQELMMKNNAAVRDCEGSQMQVGQYLYLEGHEYLMYNTYDVHFYASFALAMLFPQLELSLQLDIADSVSQEDMSVRRMMGEGGYGPRKVKDAVPHDVGSPSETPWIQPNAYNFQDVSRWKDLGPKFVLQIYRDCVALKSRSYQHDGFLQKVYPVVRTVMQRMEDFDPNKTGMIENGGFPDQTYDIWTAKGVHAYCGGLWICACLATATMAQQFEDVETAGYYHGLAEKARSRYVALLWNAERKYLRYDSSNAAHHDSIMADMLAGQWYSRACGLPEIIPLEKIHACLKTIYKYNVQAFGEGEFMGAVNGTRPSSSNETVLTKVQVDHSCLQSREVWTGTTYALAATMLAEALEPTLEEDLRQELMVMAFNTARGIHDAGWQKFGYWFATPEAWEKSGNYRSLGYMRPLSIWAMQYALEFQR